MADGKWITGVPPDAPAAEAARAVLAARFGVVAHFLPLAAVKPFEDVEYVHQLRVGTRRAGAAVRVFADWLPKKPRKAATAALRSIRRAAGGARDWDVLLQSLPAARPLSTEAGKPALDFLLGYALGERSAAQTRLAEVADEVGPKFVAASTALPARVRDPDRPDGSPPVSFGALAHDHLGGLLTAFTAAARADPSAPAELHALRIRAKQVRYAMEIFAGCFTAPLRDALYPAVEAVQESLGVAQDAAVGAERLAAVRALAGAVLPAEWPRFKKGTTALTRGMKAKLAGGRGRFAAWQEGWEKLTADYPLESLRVRHPA